MRERSVLTVPQGEGRSIHLVGAQADALGHLGGRRLEAHPAVSQLQGLLRGSPRIGGSRSAPATTMTISPRTEAAVASTSTPRVVRRTSS